MDDCISRKAAIDALAEYIHNVDKVMGTGHLTADDCKDAATSVFEELPSAERKKGKWNEERFKHLLTGEIRPVRVCSVCDAGWFRYDITDGVEDFTPKFCPNCGADMRGETDE